MKKTTSTKSAKSAKSAATAPVKSKRAAPARKPPRPGYGPNTGNDKAVVHGSAIHGRGVVARTSIKTGDRICEYRGERIGWPEALRRHPHDPEQPFHTFYFSVTDDLVIDGNARGNFSRFINHSCEPNCEAEMDEVRGVTRVFIHALRNIAKGEELTYNYGLTLDERYTPTLKKQFACHCGSAKCSGTMLSPKR
jgi:uncharacterized protein